MKRLIVSALVAIFLASCGTSAHVENSWRDTGATVSLSQLNKVLVIALLKNDVNRRATETHLVNKLNGKGVPSFAYFNEPDFNVTNDDALKQKLTKEGFDGVIILRLADVDKDVQYVPGSGPTYGFYPYFRASWNAYYTPGHFETTRKFTVETNVFSLKKDKLVWSSLTSAVDPPNAEKMMQAVGKEVYNQMKKEGFLVTK